MANGRNSSRKGENTTTFIRTRTKSAASLPRQTLDLDTHIPSLYTAARRFPSLPPSPTPYWTLERKGGSGIAAGNRNRLAFALSAPFCTVARGKGKKREVVCGGWNYHWGFVGKRGLLPELFLFKFGIRASLESSLIAARIRIDMELSGSELLLCCFHARHRRAHSFAEKTQREQLIVLPNPIQFPGTRQN